MDLVGIALIIIALAFVALVVFNSCFEKVSETVDEAKNHLNFN